MPARIEPAAHPYPANVQAAFDRFPRSWMPPFRLFTTLARHAELFERFIRGAPSYLPGSHVSVRQREVLLLRVTARCRCEYEWGMRVHYFADEAGLTAGAGSRHGARKRRQRMLAERRRGPDPARRRVARQLRASATSYGARYAPRSAMKPFSN